MTNPENIDIIIFVEFNIFYGNFINKNGIIPLHTPKHFF